MSLNTVVLSGRLGSDPSMKYTPSGMAVINFSVAVDRFQKGEKKTDWFDVTAFKELAERVNQYCAKGSQVGIEGRLQQERWETQDGQKRSKVVVVANSVQFLGSKNEQQQGGGQQGKANGAPPPAGWGANSGWGADDLSVDEIPF